MLFCYCFDAIRVSRPQTQVIRTPVMLTKALHLIHPRVSCPTKRCLSSQLVQSYERNSKGEDRCRPSATAHNPSDRSLTDAQRQELSRVIKSPVQMDIYFETRLREVPLLPTKSWWDSKGGFSADFLAELHRKWDVSWSGIKRKLRWYINLREMFNQRYIARRHAILGPELATAHFIIYRGGKVRFKHAPNKWVYDCRQLPNVYDTRFRLIAVDASDLKLRWEAMDNLTTLNTLEELNLSKNKLLDDYVCDKLARIFRNSRHLSVLDLSDNPLISHRGVEALHRIKSLKRLVIKGTKAANDPFIELLIILFNDVNPNCEIIVK